MDGLNQFAPEIRLWAFITQGIGSWAVIIRKKKSWAVVTSKTLLFLNLQK
jgi:hypothetical protein